MDGKGERLERWGKKTKKRKVYVDGMQNGVHWRKLCNIYIYYLNHSARRVNQLSRIRIIISYFNTSRTHAIVFSSDSTETKSSWTNAIEEMIKRKSND